MSIIKTEIVTIGEFLLNENLDIPHFQRPYKWSVRNVTQLLDDIQRYKENKTSKIVDGQQRTITFLLIVKGILVNKYDQLKNDDLKKLLSNIKTSAFDPKFKNEKTKKNIQDNYREIERRL